MIRPILQTFGAVLLIAAALAIAAFGFEGTLIFLGRHDLVLIGGARRDAVAIAMGIAGALLWVGVWAEYPEWRKPLVWATALPVAWVAWEFVAVFGGSVIR
jgi:hypothetical protein